MKVQTKERIFLALAIFNTCNLTEYVFNFQKYKIVRKRKDLKDETQSSAPLRSKCRTLTKRNAATNEATANTSKSITRPPTKLGTDIQIVSGSAVRADCITTVSLLALLLRAKLTSPVSRLYIRGLTVKSIVSRRLRTPRKSSRPSTERGRPPNDTKFPPSKSSLRFTVLYCPACPGNGGGGKCKSLAFGVGDCELAGPESEAPLIGEVLLSILKKSEINFEYYFEMSYDKICLLHSVAIIALACKELNQSTLHACWRPLLPQTVQRGNSMPSEEAKFNRIISVAYNLEGNRFSNMTIDDVRELFKEETLNEEEFIELINTSTFKYAGDYENIRNTTTVPHLNLTDLEQGIRITRAKNLENFFVEEDLFAARSGKF
ncbi:hypothetical protein GQX74_003751 [Glossina fuscipes]|nr:hypothetical protein GQX74_003751 [Glossina fuscipes]